MVLYFRVPDRPQQDGVVAGQRVEIILGSHPPVLEVIIRPPWIFRPREGHARKTCRGVSRADRLARHFRPDAVPFDDGDVKLFQGSVSVQSSSSTEKISATFTLNSGSTIGPNNFARSATVMCREGSFAGHSRTVDIIRSSEFDAFPTDLGRRRHSFIAVPWGNQSPGA